MYITINKKELAEVVMKVVRYSERRSATLPVLGAILLVADKKGIYLEATNLETGARFFVEGSVKKEGSVALSGVVLKEVATSLSSSGVVSIEQQGDTVRLSGDGVKSTLKTVSSEDFPTLPLSDDAKIKVILQGVVFKTLIHAVAPYASTSTVRPELSSVLLKASGGSIVAVATDSFRLAEKKLPLEGSLPQFSMLIPAKNALLIAETLTDGEVVMHIDDHQALFLADGEAITTRLVASEYPDYAQIIPKTFTATATVLKKDFEGALRRVAIFSDSFQKIRFNIQTTEKQVTLESHNADVGETEESIPAQCTGESISLSFNHRYLQAPLASMSNESISLASSGIGRPLVITGLGDSGFLYLVMPMNQ